MFYYPLKSLLLRTKCVLKHQDFQMFGFNETDMGHCHPLEVVGRGSETQLQVGEKFIYLIQRF